MLRYRTRPRTGLWRAGYARYPYSRLKIGSPAAHLAIRLVLLGSPPDTVHGTGLRGTDLSSLLIWGRRHSPPPGAGIHPCCSGLQVQGTANSPTSAALPRAGRICAVHRKAVFDIIHHFLPFSNITFDFFKKGLYKRPIYAIIFECSAAWACSAVGSAFEWHSKGQGFDSP